MEYSGGSPTELPRLHVFPSLTESGSDVPSLRILNSRNKVGTMFHSDVLKSFWLYDKGERLAKGENCSWFFLTYYPLRIDDVSSPFSEPDVDSRFFFQISQRQFANEVYLLLF